MGVAQDMLLCITVSFALLEGSFNGCDDGALRRLLIDLVCGGSLGFYALQYLIVGYVAGLPRGRFYVDNVFAAVAFCRYFFGLKSVLLLLLLFVSGSDSSMLLIIVRFVPLGALLSALLMLPVHALKPQTAQNAGAAACGAIGSITFLFEIFGGRIGAEDGEGQKKTDGVSLFILLLFGIL